jgi:hypothetical protein
VSPIGASLTSQSKKVQKFVAQVEKQAELKVDASKGKKGKGGAGAASGAAYISPDEARYAKKAALAKKMEEMSLMNQAVVEKPKKVVEDQEATRKRREEEEAERIRVANLPIEDQIEEERAKIKIRTPVTLELFNAWKAKKRAAREMVDAIALEKAQKGLSRADRARGNGLTGRMLFETHRDIFVDDEAADDTRYERDANAWIGDDSERKEGDESSEEGSEESGENGRDLGSKDKIGAVGGGSSKQNTPSDEHEPPLAEDVGDASLFT